MGITAAMEVWDPLSNTEQGEGGTMTEAPAMAGQGIPGAPASTSVHSWETPEDVCSGDVALNNADLGGREDPDEAE